MSTLRINSQWHNKIVIPTERTEVEGPAVPSTGIRSQTQHRPPLVIPSQAEGSAVRLTGIRC
jgi:hypothetical protein